MRFSWSSRNCRGRRRLTERVEHQIGRSCSCRLFASSLLTMNQHFQLSHFIDSPIYSGPLFRPMSTQIPPPPKRQRTKPSANTIDRNAAAPTIVVQLRNAQDGTLLGPPLTLPADTTREGLELLANNLKGTVSASSSAFEPHQLTITPPSTINF